MLYVIDRAGGGGPGTPPPKKKTKSATGVYIVYYRYINQSGFGQKGEGSASVLLVNNVVNTDNFRYVNRCNANGNVM